MKFNVFSVLIFTLLFLYGGSCLAQDNNSIDLIPRYVPVDEELHNKIVALDKKYFDAYNQCDLEKQASMYAEDLEFFHDQGGLNTSKKEIITSIKENICGKVTRTLIEGSIEVYPINNYGAVEIGYHKFYNNQEPNAISRPSKFIIVWKNENGTWLITKVISLH